MKKKIRIAFVSGVMVGLFAVICYQAEAQLAVELLTDPMVQTIPLDAGSKPIMITTRTNQEQVQFAWKLTGPGNLQGVETDPDILYIPPKRIQGATVPATVTVTVSDEQGGAASQSVTFTLLAETPPTPAPPDTLEELQKILLHDLKTCQELKKLEQQGEDTSERIIPALRSIIADLKAMEQMLQNKADQAAAENKDAILQRLQNAHKQRVTFEQELRERLQR